MTHRPELLDDVARQFEQHEQPLNLAWMEARGVTLEEVHALSDKIALVIRGYAAMAPRDQIAFVRQGIFNRAPDKNTGAEPL